jgi:hypothetical protein
MSNWTRWPNAPLNEKFANIEHPDRIVYPDLRDGSPLVLACDHSGEHAPPEFRVLSFLLTTYKSVAAWEALRSEVRKKQLADGRRMSFKALNDALRINAFSSFLYAASQLNGVLICVGVEKGFSLPKDNLPSWKHDWAADTLNKLVEICVFGGVMVDGLRDSGQNVHWITDDDSTVSTDKAKDDAITLMSGLLHKYPEENLEVGLGIASQFDDDLRAEDLVAIPDLAAGAYSETLTNMGKANIPTSGSGPSGTALLVQIKSSLINTWRSETDKPLKHMNAVIRLAEGGRMLVSFGAPFPRMLRSGEATEGAPTLNAKWRRALEADLRDSGVDPDEVLKSMGIDI